MKQKNKELTITSEFIINEQGLQDVLEYLIYLKETGNVKSTFKKQKEVKKK